MRSYFILLLLLIIMIIGAPEAAFASYRSELAGWIPWWTDTAGLQSATKQIEKLDTVYPFVYEIDSAGEIVDKAGLDERQWEDFLELADDEHVEVIPTIAWFDGSQIHAVLSNTKKRRALINDIEELVDDNNFDGINIDFEQKEAKTIDLFSRFLKDLNKALGRDLLTCAIEARTPAKDLYKVVPNPLTYANDYEAINKYCDRIELMTYDQQRADLTLNDQRKGLPYVPVADTDWVEKVVDLALEDFDKRKVLLGASTYGRAWDITVAPEWYKSYKSVAALNHPRILELSKIYNSPVGRSDGGEGVISYFPKDSPYKLFNALPTPAGTPKGYEAAAKALLVANLSKVEVPVRFVSYSDAISIKEKLELAEKYNLRGVTLFKIDGEEDQAIWKLF